MVSTKLVQVFDVGQMWSVHSAVLHEMIRVLMWERGGERESRRERERETRSGCELFHAVVVKVTQLISPQ